MMHEQVIEIAFVVLPMEIDHIQLLRTGVTALMKVASRASRKLLTRRKR